MKKNAITEEVTSIGEAIKALSASPPPSAVLVIDAAISKESYKTVLKRLIQYAQAGGRVVLACQFGNELEHAETEPFFRKWGLPWSFGSYFRSTYALNPAGTPSLLNAANLFPQYSMNTKSLRNLRTDEAVYVLTSESYMETTIHAPHPFGPECTRNSPVVLGRVGEGWLGFVGDVNSEQETTHAVLEMCGVSWRPGELGKRVVSVGVRMRLDGGVEKMQEMFEEKRAPVHVRPKGPRETEVTARLVKRYLQARVKQANGDRLKEQVSVPSEHL